jgi:DNA (cytosine-5)-methyltransferase 1
VLIGSLFSGIGGLELGLEAAGVGRTVWQVERDPHCLHWLAQHWPNAGRVHDVARIDELTERVDVLCGGFPCQPHSLAGKREAHNDDRDLWPEFIRCIRLLRPGFVVAENVPGLFTSDGGRFFNRILSDLAEAGYDAEWDVLSAAEVGAPQKRERVFIIAWRRNGMAVSEREQRGRVSGEVARSAEGRPFKAETPTDSRSAILGDTTSGGRGTREELAVPRPTRRRAGMEHAEGERRGETGRLRPEFSMGSAGTNESLGDSHDTERRPHDEQSGNAASAGADVGDARFTRLEGHAGNGDDGHESGRVRTESARSAAEAGLRLGRWSDAVPVRGYDGTVRLIPREAADVGPQSSLWPVAPRIPGRVARLRAIGNAVVPPVAEVIGRRLLEIAAELDRQRAA